MTTDTSHNELATRISAGDQAAEDELFRKFQRPVQTMLQGRCGDTFLAEDLLQDTFHVVLTRLRKEPLENPSALASFVYRTALNLWIGHVRKEVRRKTEANSDLINQAANSESDEDSKLELASTQSAVRRLLSELANDRDREILFRTFVLDEEKRVVQQALDLSSANFDRVIYRAKKRFRRLVEENQEDLP